MTNEQIQKAITEIIGKKCELCKNQVETENVTYEQIEKMIDEAILKNCESCKKTEKPENKRELEKLKIEAIKAEKLLHYSRREPKDFVQFDGFVNTEGDCVMKPDADGDCIFSSDTVELMTGNVDVRLLVVPVTSQEDVARVLDKFKGWVQSDRGGKVELMEMEPKRIVRDYDSSIPF